MGELVDLVDADGKIQIEALPREQAFANRDPDLYVPIAVAVVFNGLDQVLLQQRAWLKPVDGGKLDFVCGVISSGELPIDTAARESEEETAVIPENLQLVESGINRYGHYRSLFVGRTESTGKTVEWPNHEVEWAGMVALGQITELKTGWGYRTVGDFEEHLDMAIMHSMLSPDSDTAQ